MTLRAHYERTWGPASATLTWQKKPLPDLDVLVFAPRPGRNAWTYATCGMAGVPWIEVHVFAPFQDTLHVELLTVVAAYHRTGAALGLGHTVNIGRPWLPGSRCDHGLISLPYIDGPVIENCDPVKCYWFIPITKAERDYKAKHGLEALEREFEATSFNYLDPARESVV
jgi:hypothetical protein